jgi:hypothetical protein
VQNDNYVAQVFAQTVGRESGKIRCQERYSLAIHNLLQDRC